MQTRPPLAQIVQTHSGAVSVTVSDRRQRRHADSAASGPRRAPVPGGQSIRLPAPWPAAPMAQVAAPPVSVVARARRHAQATEPANAAVCALRAQYPFIQQAASAYVDDMLSALGLSAHDRNQLLLVRFNKPSAQQRADMRTHGKLRIASVAEIAGRRALADVLTRGFGQYLRTDMGAARGQFGIYTRAQIERQVPLATGDAAALAAYRASRPDAAGALGEIAPSRIDSGRLYGKLERIGASGQGFRQRYEQRLQQYWSRQEEPLATQQRRIALDMAMAAYAGDALDDRDLELAVDGVGGAVPDRVKVYALDAGGHRSHNALRIEDVVSGRNLLYLPGSRIPWRGFDDAHAARQWLAQKVADPGWRSRFVQRHFTLLPAGQGASLQAQLAARDRVVPLLTADPVPGAQPFLGLVQWQRQQDLELLAAAIDDGDFSAAQQAQRAAWRVLEGAQAAQQKGLAAVATSGAAPTNAARQAATGQVGLPSVSALERKLQEIAWQQPDLRASAAHYATQYLRQHFGVTLAAQDAYLTGFVPRLPDLGRLPSNFGGMAIAELIPQRLADAARMPVLPSAQLKQRVALDELFIRNFDQTDGNLTNRKGATAFGVFTEADFAKKNMTVDTWRRIDLGTAEAPHDPDLAASRIDATALYRQMTRPASEGGNDFANVYRQQVADFWNTHRSTLTGLHQQAAMSRLDDAMQAGKLDESAHAFFRQGLENRIGSTVQAHPLALAGRVSGNGLRLIDSNGNRTGLYLPGEAQPFRMFANRAALEEWFNQRAKDGAWIARFTRNHFSVTDANGLDGETGVVEFLEKDFRQGYPSYGRAPLYPKALSPTQRIEGDPFDFLSRTRQEKDLQDANWLVTSNGEYKNKKIVRDLEPIPLAGDLAQAYLGRGSERSKGVTQLIDDMVTVASVVIPESLPARAGAQAVAAADAGLVVAEGAAAPGAAAPGTTAPAIPAEYGLQRRFAGLLGEASIDHRVEPAIDHGISLMGLAPDASQVYTVGGQQYIDLAGHAARIQGLSNQGRRAVLVDTAGQALHGAQVWRDAGGHWQVGALKGGAPGWAKLLSGARKEPLDPVWGQLPGSAAAGIHPALVGMPSALYDANLSTAEIQAFVRNQMTQPGNEAIRRSVAAKVAASEALLLRDTNAFARQAHPGRSSFAAPPANAADADILASMYGQSSGLILGETHAEAAPVMFLLDNMAALRRHGVRTLYVELPDDLVGPDLEQFNRGKPMSSNLSNYLNHGIVARTDPRYRSIDVLRAARAEGIEIRAVDTLAADQFSGTGANRLATMNYYAYRTIQADQQANPRKWVAWIGAGHSNNTNPTGFPGLGQLLGVPSIRLRDVASGGARTFGVDRPGVTVVGPNGTRSRLSNDWVLRLPRRP